MRLLVSMMCLLVLGCGPNDDDGEVERVEFACTLGVAGPDGTGFLPLDGVAEAEITLGFQGFLWFSVRLASDDEPLLEDNRVLYGAEIPGVDPFGAARPNLPPASDPIHSEDLQVFVHGEPSEYVGLNAVVTVRYEDATRFCLATGTVTLVDDDPCLHTGEEPICPDDKDRSRPK